MKKILISVAFACIGLFSHAQLLTMATSFDDSWARKRLYSEGRIAVYSPHRDTLFVSDDQVGATIKKLWEMYPSSSEKTPFIVFLSYDELLYRFFFYYRRAHGVSKQVSY